jgi:hypothetical protein
MWLLPWNQDEALLGWRMRRCRGNVYQRHGFAANFAVGVPLTPPGAPKSSKTRGWTRWRPGYGGKYGRLRGESANYRLYIAQNAPNRDDEDGPWLSA